MRSRLIKIFYIPLLNNLRFLILCISSLVFFSCSSEEEELLASYKDEDLTLRYVLNNIPSNTIDTNSFIAHYTQSWIRNKMLLDKAKMYVHENDIDIVNPVKDYKESLLIHKYHTELLSNQFDTNVSREEIEKYYKKHFEDFILQKDIVKARYVMINNIDSRSSYEKMRHLITMKNQSDIDELNNLCELYENRCFLNDSTWFYFSDFIHQLPISLKESENILFKKNKIYSFTSDNLICIVFLEDYQIKGGNSPLSFVFEDIKELLQSKNKIQFISDIEDKLYSDALSSGEIKIYK